MGDVRLFDLQQKRDRETHGTSNCGRWTPRLAVSLELMKYLLLGLLAAFGWPLGSGGASAATPAELLQSCQAVVSAARPIAGQTIDIPAEGLPCWYYMEAIQNMSVLVDQAGEPLIGVCAPPDLTLMHYIRIFVAAARENAGEGNAAALAVQELARSFRCGQSAGH